MSFVLPKYTGSIFKRSIILSFSNIANIKNNTSRRFYEVSAIQYFCPSQSTPVLKNVRSRKINERKMSSTSPNKFVPINDEIRELLVVWSDIIRDVLNRCRNPELKETFQWVEKVLQYNIPGGRMHRGLTVVYAFKSLAAPELLTEENIRLARILAWCVEMLQGFFLVLDDIQDNGQIRRNQPCWHLLPDVGLRATNDCLLIQMTIYNLLKKYFQLKDCYIDLINLFIDATSKTAVGQNLDMQSSASLQRFDFNYYTMGRYSAIVKYKTSYYTYVLPTLCAMYFAGIKDPEVHAEAKTILLQMGHMFQVRDDYLGVYATGENADKSATDISEGKCSWLIVVALERASQEQRKRLKECFGVADEERVNQVKKIYEELEIPKLYATYEEETHNLINSRIKQLSDASLRDFYHHLIQRTCTKVGKRM